MPILKRRECIECGCARGLSHGNERDQRSPRNPILVHRGEPVEHALTHPWEPELRDVSSPVGRRSRRVRGDDSLLPEDIVEARARRPRFQNARQMKSVAAPPAPSVIVSTPRCVIVAAVTTGAVTALVSGGTVAIADPQLSSCALMLTNIC